MTTSKSPLHLLKAQADRIAKIMKAAERGETIGGFDAAEARKRDAFNVAIAMDDKILTVDIPWKTIREADEVALSELIVAHMRGETIQ